MWVLGKETRFHCCAFPPFFLPPSFSRVIVLSVGRWVNAWWCVGVMQSYFLRVGSLKGDPFSLPYFSFISSASSILNSPSSSVGKWVNALGSGCGAEILSSLGFQKEDSFLSRCFPS